MKKLITGIVLLLAISLLAYICFNVEWKKNSERENVFSGSIKTNPTTSEQILFEGWRPGNIVSFSWDAGDDTIIVEGDPGALYTSVSVGDVVMFNTASAGFDNSTLIEGTKYFVRTASLSDRFEISTSLGNTILDIGTTASTDGTDFFTREVMANIVNVEGMEHISLSIIGEEAASCGFKFVGSIQNAGVLNGAPNLYASQSLDNQYETIGVFDVATQTEVEGDTGLPFTGTDDTRLFDIYTDNLNWFSIISNQCASGSFKATLKTIN